MKILTEYYAYGVGEPIPVTIIDKQILPMQSNEALNRFTISRRTDYTVKWLSKWDSEAGYNVAITFTDDQNLPLTVNLKLSRLKLIKMKLIWGVVFKPLSVLTGGFFSLQTMPHTPYMEEPKNNS